MGRENKTYFVEEIIDCQNTFLFNPYVREKIFDEGEFKEVL